MMDGTKTELELDQISSALAGIVGVHRILEEEADSSEYRIKAFVKAFPENERQVAEVLRFSNEHRLSVVPQGGGTKDAYSQSTKAAHLILSMKGMSGVLEHSYL
jgi:glycolate oxidase FAD binding subunit